MKYSDFLIKCDIVLGSIISQTGFRRSQPGTWNRNRGDEFNVIWLQKDRTKEAFCVNLGIHYSFLPSAGRAVPLGPTPIPFGDCEFMLRLTSQHAASDQWWPLSEESVPEVVEVIRLRALAIFDAYRLSGPISQMTATDITNGDQGLLAPLGRVRACLFLALMHEWQGNQDQCLEAARLGVNIAGVAVGPKVALKMIIQRVETNEGRTRS